MRRARCTRAPALPPHGEETTQSLSKSNGSRRPTLASSHRGHPPPHSPDPRGPQASGTGRTAGSALPRIALTHPISERSTPPPRPCYATLLVPGCHLGSPGASWRTLLCDRRKRSRPDHEQTTTMYYDTKTGSRREASEHVIIMTQNKTRRQYLKLGQEARIQQGDGPCLNL